MDDILGKAKDALGEHSEQVKEGVEKAADFIKGKVGDSGDQKVDQATSAIEGFLGK